MTDYSPKDKELAEKASQYVSEIMERADSPPPNFRTPHPAHRLRLLLSVLLPLTLGLTAWNAAKFIRQEKVVTAEEEFTYGRFVIYTAVQAITYYRDSTGALPANLTEAGLQEDDVAYSVDGPMFRVTYETATVRIAYGGGDDLEPFEGAFAQVIGENPL